MFFSFSAVHFEKLKLIFAQEVIIQGSEQGLLDATLHRVLLGRIGWQTQHVLQVVEEQGLKHRFASTKEFNLLYVKVKTIVKASYTVNKYKQFVRFSNTLLLPSNFGVSKFLIIFSPILSQYKRNLTSKTPKITPIRTIKLKSFQLDVLSTRN